MDVPHAKYIHVNTNSIDGHLPVVGVRDCVCTRAEVACVLFASVPHC